jgi:hypothetical protein
MRKHRLPEILTIPPGTKHVSGIAPGASIGLYVLVRQIGEGGMVATGGQGLADPGIEERVPGLVPLAARIGRAIFVRTKSGLCMVLFAFICLQVMDTLTTLLFLRHGVHEANPLIRAALVSADPGIAVGVPKVLAIGLAMVAWYSGRKKLLRKVNVLYFVFVVWNLAAAWAG